MIAQSTRVLVVYNVVCGSAYSYEISGGQRCGLDYLGTNRQAALPLLLQDVRTPTERPRRLALPRLWEPQLASLIAPHARASMELPVESPMLDPVFFRALAAGPAERNATAVQRASRAGRSLEETVTVAHAMTALMSQLGCQ